ncbi:hypothetical protein BROUX41_003885 [Berkeleyomyces rouxiae]|uniref:uncharacterized protein n=1 Tax=Berkeleyomyces rouxiae TaxID=2035830 RepID=UPI003B78E574
MARLCRAIGLSRPFSHLSNHAAKATSSTDVHPTPTTPSGPVNPAGYIPSAFETLPAFNPTTKTIKTAAGTLPASPIMDPEWRMTQGFFRAPKPRPRPPVGRFRRLLSRSPYARMLASPLRLDPLTNAFLPRDFLASFEVIQHPETGKPWWAPMIDDAPLLRVQPSDMSMDTEAEVQVQTDEDAHEEEEVAAAAAAAATTTSIEADVDPDPSYIPTPRLANAPAQPPRSSPGSPSRASAQITTQSNLRAHTALSAHALAILDRRLTGSPKAFPFLASRRANHMAWVQRTPPVWRDGMTDVLLQMLRARALDDFALLADPTSLGKEYPNARGEEQGQEQEQEEKEEGVRSARAPMAYGSEWLSPLVSVASWADLPGAVPEKTLRGAVLWLSRSADAMVPAEVSKDQKTYEFSGAQYNAHVPIHNLPKLLGEEGLQKVLDMFPEMNDTELVLLVRPATIHLRKRLWQLEGYINGNPRPQGHGSELIFEDEP